MAGSPSSGSGDAKVKEEIDDLDDDIDVEDDDDAAGQQQNADDALFNNTYSAEGEVA